MESNKFISELISVYCAVSGVLVLAYCVTHFFKYFNLSLGSKPQISNDNKICKHGVVYDPTLNGPRWINNPTEIDLERYKFIWLR